MIRLLPILLIVYFTKTGNGAPAFGGLEHSSNDYQQQKSAAEGILAGGSDSELRKGVVVEDSAWLTAKDEKDTASPGPEVAPILQARKLNDRAESKSRATIRKDCGLKSIKEQVRKTGTLAKKKLALTFRRPSKSSTASSPNEEEAAPKQIKRRLSDVDYEEMAAKRRRAIEAPEEVSRVGAERWKDGINDFQLRRGLCSTKRPAAEAEAEVPTSPPTADQQFNEGLLSLAGKAAVMNPNDPFNLKFLSTAVENYNKAQGKPLIAPEVPMSPRSKAASSLLAFTLQKVDEKRRQQEREREEREWQEELERLERDELKRLEQEERELEEQGILKELDELERKRGLGK